MPTYRFRRLRHVFYEFILYYKEEFSLFDKVQYKFSKQILSKSFVEIAMEYLDWRTNESSFYSAVY
jgi:hypothetical protein